MCERRKLQSTTKPNSENSINYFTNEPTHFRHWCSIVNGGFGYYCFYNRQPLQLMFHVKQEAEMKIGYLRKDRREVFNMRRAWFANAWRIVDAKGDDMVQPWPKTKTEARETARALNIVLKGEWSLEVAKE